MSVRKSGHKVGDRALTHDLSFDEVSGCYSAMLTLVRLLCYAMLCCAMLCPGGPGAMRPPWCTCLPCPVSKTSGEAMSFFKKMDRSLGGDTVGPQVDADLAEGTDRFFKKPMSPEG